MTLSPLMLWIAASTPRNHSSTNMVKVVNRERMYETCVIRNVMKGNEKSVDVFEVVERVEVVPLPPVMVEGGHVRWTCHLDIGHVLSKVLGMVGNARGAKGLHGGRLLRTFRGGFCAGKQQMQVAVKGSTTDE
jgi:hypothetical protein